MSSNWPQIRELFEAALEIPSDQRSGFLRERCGDDAELLARIQRLLDNDARAGDQFLKTAPSDPRLSALLAADDAPDPLIGRTIAAYTIKTRIARGGMGTVYLADQANPKREVALKVLHAGLWSGSAEKRFEFESQVLARLHHPNIAQVYEAGEVEVAADVPVGRSCDEPLERESLLVPQPDGIPIPNETGARTDSRTSGGQPTVRVSYFAMEYVLNARRITDYANEHGLDIRRRLDLFLQVCEAIHYGHQRGIIHRDLKPANILVGASEPAAPATGLPQASSRFLSLSKGKPQAFVKVIDFGVARVVDSDVAVTTMHTETGQLIGTLAYMSPEQCDADPLGLDVRSDVYSLGVVLYELLCGRLPYDVSTTSIVAAARTIKEQPPTRPSAITKCGTGYQPVKRRRGTGHIPSPLEGEGQRGVIGTDFQPVEGPCGTGYQPVKGDLETILLKCLEKDRAKRYQSAADLAADIRR